MQSQEERVYTESAVAGMLSRWDSVAKTNLNTFQKNIIDGYLGYLLDNLSGLPLNIQIDALLAMKSSQVSEKAIAVFREKEIWETIEDIRHILKHQHPQNRCNGDFNAFIAGHLKGRDPVTPEEIEAAETGVYQGMVYYFSSGFGSTLCKEPRGIFGLTGRNRIVPPRSSRFFLLPTFFDPSQAIKWEHFKNSILIVNGSYEIKKNRSNHQLEFYYINPEGYSKKIMIDELSSLENALKTLGLLTLLTKKSPQSISLDNQLTLIDSVRNPDERLTEKFKTCMLDHMDLGAPEITPKDVYLYLHEIIDKKLAACFPKRGVRPSLPVGLPQELGYQIGRFFDRKTAANVAQTCKSAYRLACDAREKYIKENGKSYQEEPYQNYPVLLLC